MAGKLPSDFYDRLMRVSHTSGATPEKVLNIGLELYNATLLQPGSREQLRVYFSLYRSLLGKEHSAAMATEAREKRASLGGQAAAANMTAEQKRARARTGAEARWRKREKALAAGKG